jgi:transcription elongation factor GreA
MPSSPTAADLLRDVGLIADGPAIWGKPVRLSAPGVFIVEMAAPAPSAPLDLALIGKWLERVPELTLDGVRPTSRDLQVRIGSFWLPTQPVLYIGSTPGSVAGRIAAITKTVAGDRKPAASGLWLHFLRNPADLRVWWAATDALEEYEDALLEAFAAGITDADRPVGAKGVMTAPASRLPWAVLRSPSGVRKETGIANPTLPEVKAPEPKPVTRIVTFPTGEADGARDEAKRPRRPAPGRGAGRVASAAAYAAQGSPRKPPPEPVLVSAEGLERLQAELDGLLAERPGVIKRIATAREHGDLKENAEYHAAREEQGFLEGRIKALEAKLKVAQVVAPTERGGRVEIGSHVTLDEDGEETVSLQVVGSAEANSREGRISSNSPVGAALMGRRVGDAVTIVTPGGEIHYRILAIE